MVGERSKVRGDAACNLHALEQLTGPVPACSTEQDLGSPATYLPYTQLPKIAAARNAEIVWRPFLLGGVFKAINSAKKKEEAAPPAAPPKPSDEVLLLTEIRDALKKA